MNEVTTPNNTSVVNYGSDMNNELDLTGGMMVSAGFVKINGKEFTMSKGGSTIPLGKTIECVIVGVGKLPSKKYYKGKYTGQEGIQPDCASANGIYPDKAFKNPECKLCANCEHTAWGSDVNQDGKPIQSCASYRRLIICVIINNQQEIYRLDVPKGSLKSAASYQELLRIKQIPVNGVITCISFADTQFTRLKFEAVQVLNQEQYNSYRPLLDDERVKKLIAMETTIVEEAEEEQQIVKGVEKEAPTVTPITESVAAPVVKAQEVIQAESATDLENKLNNILQDGEI